MSKRCNSRLVSKLRLSAVSFIDRHATHVGDNECSDCLDFVIGDGITDYRHRLSDPKNQR